MSYCYVSSYCNVLVFYVWSNRRVVSDLNWPVYYRWVMGSMGYDSKL